MGICVPLTLLCLNIKNRHFSTRVVYKETIHDDINDGNIIDETKKKSFQSQPR